MNLAGELIRTVIEERYALGDGELPTALLETTTKQAESLLASGLEVSVHVLLLHTCTPADGCPCPVTKQLEVWTVRPQTVDPEAPPILPIFLKQAVRSQLHFSPIKSWVAGNNNKIPSGYRFAYRISTNAHFNTNGAKAESHSFPACRIKEDLWLKTSVQWLNKDAWSLPAVREPCLANPPSAAQQMLKSAFAPVACSPTSESLSEQIQCLKLTPPAVVARECDATNATDDMEKLTDEFATSSLDTPSGSTETIQSSEKEIRQSRIRRNTTGSAGSVPAQKARQMPLSASFCGFNPKTKLPLNSSPAPLKRSALDLAKKLRDRCTSAYDDSGSGSDSECIGKSVLSNSSIHNGLLCNFEESVLNGRLDPLGEIDGFRLQIAATGAFSIPHVMLPVKTSFFNISDDDTPSLYLGQCSFEEHSRKALHIPKKCVFQATLFNPQGSVVKIFIAKIDVSDMPVKSRTFIRQRTLCVPVAEGASKRFLRYLIHLRLATDRRGRLYMHTDIRMLFANKEDADVLGMNAQGGQLRTVVEMEQPKYSPMK